MLNFDGDLCGHIFMKSHECYVVYCVLCESTFDSFEEFQDHNIKNHFKIENFIENDNYKNEDSFNWSSIENDEINEYSNDDQNENDFFGENSTIGKKYHIKIERVDFDYKDDETDEDVTFVDKSDLSLSNHDEDFKSLSDDKLSTVFENNSVIDDYCKSQDSCEDISTIIEFDSNNLNPEDLQCEYCQRKFNKRISLLEHIRKHLNFILTCKICGKHTSNKRNADNHKRTHSKFKCELCNVSFLKNDSLEKHKKRHELLQCKYCSKVFKKPHALQSHLRIHTGERPYKCDVCFVAFALKRNLQTHKITQHTGDIKNFACNFCEKKFKTKQLHNWHTKRVHLKEKPNQCEFCGLNFANMSGLRRHKLKHHTEYDKRPHHCELCDKKFVELKNLTEHMNTHTGLKPFICEVCFKGFGQQSTLREHKKLHTGKKIHVCKICGKAFAQHSGCANHMKLQHHMLNNSID